MQFRHVKEITLSEFERLIGIAICEAIFPFLPISDFLYNKIWDDKVKDIE